MVTFACRLVLLVSAIVSITAQDRLRGFDREGDIQAKASLTVPEEFNGLDENFLRLTLQAARLSSDIMKPTTARLYPDATIFTDEPDQTLVINIDNVCFVTFRGTVLYSIDDILTNAKLDIVDDVCFEGECCSARIGYRDAVLGNSYYEELRATVSDCANSCCDSPDCSLETDVPCETVLTGWSQGGSAAMVAGVTFRDTNPTVITFGQPTTMQVPCKVLDTDKYYRFINTRNYLVGLKYGLKYDAAPFVEEITNTYHTGRAFVLGENAGSVVSYRDGLAPDVGTLDFAVNFLATHDINDYIKKVEELILLNRFPVSMDGFPTGYPCTMNSECTVPDTCSLGFCRSGGSSQIRSRSSGLIGDACTNDIDCLPTLRCDGRVNSSCQLKLGAGARCTKQSDCISGVCQGFGREASCE